jgi:hypothetical protein
MILSITFAGMSDTNGVDKAAYQRYLRWRKADGVEKVVMANRGRWKGSLAGRTLYLPREVDSGMLKWISEDDVREVTRRCCELNGWKL